MLGKCEDHGGGSMETASKDKVEERQRNPNAQYHEECLEDEVRIRQAFGAGDEDEETKMRHWEIWFERVCFGSVRL